jgi:predicted nucleic acid-binding Zn ribbon protein
MDHEHARSETADMRAMFWTWMGIIVVGLAVMIVLPLAGR